MAMPKAATGQAMARILYGELNSSVLAAQATAFQQAGYEVQTAHGRGELERALRGGKFDVVILGHSLTRDDRHHLPYMAKKADPEVCVLVLHASGRHPEVDIALDSRDGMPTVLRALETLVTSRAGVLV
jgi:DNA-binding NtrC family response regulator